MKRVHVQDFHSKGRSRLTPLMTVRSELDVNEDNDVTIKQTCMVNATVGRTDVVVITPELRVEMENLTRSFTSPEVSQVGRVETPAQADDLRTALRRSRDAVGAQDGYAAWDVADVWAVLREKGLLPQGS